MLRIILNCPPFFRSRARYVFETWLTYYHLPFSVDDNPQICVPDTTFTIYYGDPDAVSTELLGEDGGLLIPFHPETENYFANRKVYNPQAARRADGLIYLFPCLPIEKPEGWKVLAYDIVASAFY